MGSWLSRRPKNESNLSGKIVIITGGRWARCYSADILYNNILSTAVGLDSRLQGSCMSWERQSILACEPRGKRRMQSCRFKLPSASLSGNWNGFRWTCLRSGGPGSRPRDSWTWRIGWIFLVSTQMNEVYTIANARLGSKQCSDVGLVISYLR